MMSKNLTTAHIRGSKQHIRTREGGRIKGEMGMRCREQANNEKR